MTSFAKTWVDSIQEFHAEISEIEIIRFTRDDGTTVWVREVVVSFHPSSGEIRGVQAYGTTDDGAPSKDAFSEDGCPEELAPLIPVLIEKQQSCPDES